MIVVDTSVCIDYVMNGINTDQTELLDRALLQSSDQYSSNLHYRL